MKKFIERHRRLVALLVIWTIPWKGVALWKSARRNDKPWFATLLVVNSAGILEILYIFFFSKSRKTYGEE